MTYDSGIPAILGADSLRKIYQVQGEARHTAGMRPARLGQARHRHVLVAHGLDLQAN